MLTVLPLPTVHRTALPATVAGHPVINALSWALAVALAAVLVVLVFRVARHIVHRLLGVAVSVAVSPCCTVSSLPLCGPGCIADQGQSGGPNPLSDTSQVLSDWRVSSIVVWPLERRAAPSSCVGVTIHARCTLACALGPGLSGT